MDAIWSVLASAGPVPLLLGVAVSGLCGALGVLWRKLSVVEVKLETCQQGRLADMRETLESERSRGSEES